MAHKQQFTTKLAPQNRNIHTLLFIFSPQSFPFLWTPGHHRRHNTWTAIATIKKGNWFSHSYTHTHTHAVTEAHCCNRLFRFQYTTSLSKSCPMAPHLCLCRGSGKLMNVFSGKNGGGWWCFSVVSFFSLPSQLNGGLDTSVRERERAAHDKQQKRQRFQYQFSSWFGVQFYGTGTHTHVQNGPIFHFTNRH